MQLKMMVYIDGREQSMTAAEYAVFLAEKFDAELYAVFVVDKKTLEDLLHANIFVESEELDFENDLIADGKKYLKEVEIMGKEKNREVKTLLLEGEINQEVVKAVREHKIKMLVLGEIEFSTSRTESFYSENERILRRVKCPTVVVPNTEYVHDLFDEM